MAQQIQIQRRHHRSVEDVPHIEQPMPAGPGALESDEILASAELTLQRIAVALGELACHDRV